MGRDGEWERDKGNQKTRERRGPWRRLGGTEGEVSQDSDRDCIISDDM